MADAAVELACGTWPSPLAPERVAAGAVALAWAGMADGCPCWTEGRPAERGRTALMQLRLDGTVAEVLGPEADVRTRVMEYGGHAWARVGAHWLVPQAADQRLRLVDEQGRSRVLTPEGCCYADFTPLADGRRVLAVREDHRAGGEPRNELVLIDTALDADEGRVLAGSADFVASPRISPCGTRLAWIEWDHPHMPWDESRLRVAELHGDAAHEPRTVAGRPGESLMQPEWGEDGTLYVLSDRSDWWNLMAWRDGEWRSLTSLQAELGGPLWNLGQRSWALLGQGRALLSVGRQAVDRLAVLDLASGALRTLDLPYVAYGSVVRAGDGQALALAASVDRLPELIRIDADSGRHEVLRRAGEPLLEPAFVSRPRAVEFPTRPGADGEPRTAHAWFYPPTHPRCRVPADTRPPLVVVLHGGPTSHAMPVFKPTTQYWTTRGYAVVDVNYGGSSGFGRAYRERLRGQWGVVDLQDAVAAVDHLVAQGWVDGDRVVIRGGSAGGFTVLSALVFTQRFAAGINYFGVADLATLAEDTHKFESRYLDGLVGPLPQAAELYRQRSPLHHMKRCHGALITFQGSDDRAVPPQQSRDVTAAARAAGCPVAYLEFEGEGHGFRQGPNIVRALQSEEVFLGRVFGHQPAGDLPPVDIDNEAALGR